MSKNVKVNGVDYTGVSQVQLPTTDGATALFKDVDEITEGGGGFDIDTAETLLCTVETEDLIGNILAAHPITPKYQNELLILIIRGGNVSTQGDSTLRSIYWCINGTTTSALEGYVSNKKVAPDTIKVFYGSGSEEKIAYTSGISTTYTNLDANGALRLHANYVYYVAAGNTVSYYEVPLDLTVPTIDTTLRAVE